MKHAYIAISVVIVNISENVNDFGTAFGTCITIEVIRPVKTKVNKPCFGSSPCNIRKIYITKYNESKIFEAHFDIFSPNPLNINVLILNSLGSSVK